MRAIVIKHFGGPEQLVIEERPAPEPKRGHVVIKVEAEEQVRRVIANYHTSGFNSQDGYWWALPANGEEMRFVIDWCA